VDTAMIIGLDNNYINLDKVNWITKPVIYWGESLKPISEEINFVFEIHFQSGDPLKIYTLVNPLKEPEFEFDLMSAEERSKEVYKYIDSQNEPAMNKIRFILQHKQDIFTDIPVFNPEASYDMPKNLEKS
jgi:hypothetical protein